jgi:hypothetical protein
MKARKLFFCQIRREVKEQLIRPFVSSGLMIKYFVSEFF